MGFELTRVYSLNGFHLFKGFFYEGRYFLFFGGGFSYTTLPLITNCSLYSFRYRWKVFLQLPFCGILLPGFVQ